MENTRLRLLNGEHIFYLSRDPEIYINNAVSYIESGISQGQTLFVIENSARYEVIYSRLKQRLTDEQLLNVHYEDNEAFYKRHGNFHTPTIIKHLTQLIEPFLEKGKVIKTWSHVDWGAQDAIIDKLETYESCADACINEAGITSVCAYNASNVSHALKQILMERHEFFMTDHEFIRSDLFKRVHLV